MRCGGTGRAWRDAWSYGGGKGTAADLLVRPSTSSLSPPPKYGMPRDRHLDATRRSKARTGRLGLSPAYHRPSSPVGAHHRAHRSPHPATPRTPYPAIAVWRPPRSRHSITTHPRSTIERTNGTTHFPPLCSRAIQNRVRTCQGPRMR